MARTLAEADAHGLLLLRSGLEHALVLAQALTTERGFVSYTVARTATEHCIRANYLLDVELDDQVRAARRLNEWLYAISEAQRQRQGAINAGLPRAEEIDDLSGQMSSVEERARELGHELKTTRAGTSVVDAERRPSTMSLADRYLVNQDAQGVVSAAFRVQSAVTNGTETGLMAAAVETPSSYPVNILRPQRTEVGSLAFTLMSVPLATHNATRAMAQRLHRGHEEDRWEILGRRRDYMITTWRDAISHYLDEVAPERPRTGILTLLPPANQTEKPQGDSGA